MDQANIFRANIYGGDERDRTVDLLTASQALSQTELHPRKSFLCLLPTQTRSIIQSVGCEFKFFMAVVMQQGGILYASWDDSCPQKKNREATSILAALPGFLLIAF